MPDLVYRYSLLESHRTRLSNSDAAMRAEDEKALGLQDSESLSHWRGANTQALGDFVLLHWRAWG